MSVQYAEKGLMFKSRLIHTDLGFQGMTTRICLKAKTGKADLLGLSRIFPWVRLSLGELRLRRARFRFTERSKVAMKFGKGYESFYILLNHMMITAPALFSLK